MSHYSKFPVKEHKVDFCVVGGGLSGLCAAVAAARQGKSVALVQDRPMLGGNASSEIRMWISGAHGENIQETGILEELKLENLYRNPYKNYHIWDSILLQIVKAEKNIKLFLNCTCMDGVMQLDRLEQILCWQLTTQTNHKIFAKNFADCSGDSILALITGAEYTIGREARDEHNESIAPVSKDRSTMGLSILLQAREYNEPKTFIAPPWAEHFEPEDLPYRIPDLSSASENFWYLELGGKKDTIGDTEEIRDELLAVAYGMWNFIKNDYSQKEKNANFDLDWVGILPGKRESRRYVGDYVLTQNDIENEGKFNDIAAYGGWTMDDHHPDGFRTKDFPNIFHPAPSPFGISYRCLYSKNIENLFFAGRNISVSHAALSATRVMATCALIGQAVGIAASISSNYDMTPREIGQKKLNELQEKIMDDDCWLPGLARSVPTLTKNAAVTASSAGADLLRNGYDRPHGSEDNGWYCNKDGWVTYSFTEPAKIEKLRIVFDSDLCRRTLPIEEHKLNRNMWHNRLLKLEPSYVPKTIVRDFDIVLTYQDQSEKTISIRNNYQRLFFLNMHDTVIAVTLKPKETWGSDKIHIFSFDVR